MNEGRPERISNGQDYNIIMQNNDPYNHCK